MEQWMIAILLSVLNQGLQIVANISILTGVAGVP